VKTYRLRSVYDTINLGFSDEGWVTDGVVKARLVRQCELRVATPRVASVNREGKKNIEVHIDRHVFQGHPLLLELTTTKDASIFDRLTDIRRELEDRTTELTALLTWSLQGVVGEKLADELGSRFFGAFPTEWGFDDIVPFELTDFFQDIGTVASRSNRVEQLLRDHADVQRSLAVTAMRWWRHARHTHSVLDSFLAHWIILEMFSDYAGGGKSIRERIENAVATVFPILAEGDGRQRARKLAAALYRTRCKCVHSGRSKVAHEQSVFQLTGATAHACIRYLVDGCVSEPPDHVLLTLGI
jgi:hypothetical protein